VLASRSVVIEFNTSVDSKIILSKIYKHYLILLADILIRGFNKKMDNAFITADLLLRGSLKNELKFYYIEKDRIIQRTNNSYYIKISANKLSQLEDTLKKLNKMGLAVEDSLVCKLFLSNKNKPTLVLYGRKRTIAGKDFWFFKVRKKDYEKYKDKKFIILIESLDGRVQKISRIITHFKREFKKVSKNSKMEISIEELKRLPQQPQKTGFFDDVLKRAGEYIELYLKMRMRRSRKNTNNTRTAVKQEPAQASAPASQALVEEKRQEVKNKVEQEKEEQVDKKYYEDLRRKLNEYIDWLTVKRLKEYNITHIKTFEEFKQAVDNNELVEGAEKLIKDIPMTRMHIRKFIDFLEEKGYKINRDSIFEFFNELENNQLTRDTIARYKSHLKYFVKWLGDYECFKYISDYEVVSARKGNKGQGYLYTPKQIENILKQITEHPELTEKEKEELIGLISLMYVTGLRFSEAMRLQVRDFDFENRIGIVRSSKSKKSSARPIFFTEQVRDYLVALIKKYNKKDDDLLFDRNIRFFSQPHKVRVTEFLKKLGIELKVSGLRDSYATLFDKYNLKIDIDVESITAGHSAEIRNRHYHQINIRLEEIFDNRELFKDEYEYVILLREQYDRIMKKVLKDSKILPIKL